MTIEKIPLIKVIAKCTVINVIHHLTSREPLKSMQWLRAEWGKQREGGRRADEATILKEQVVLYQSGFNVWTALLILLPLPATFNPLYSFSLTSFMEFITRAAASAYSLIGRGSVVTYWKAPKFHSATS